jgi:hypothetical protein
MTPENPYRVLGPRIPRMLGRAELASRVEARLDKQEPEHVSVVGPAMFGKSVLLREIARRYASGTRNYVASVYIDLRHGAPQSDDEARELVAGAMQRSLQPVHPELSEYFELDGIRIKERLQAVIQELAAADERLLIVIDGMDDTLANPRITREVWDNLRSLARQPVVRYLTASRRPLRDLCRTEESRAADLWEVFHGSPVIVGCFEDSDAEAVFEPLTARGMSFDPEALTELIDQTGGVPVLVSALLSLIYESCASDANVTVEEVRSAAETVITEQRELLDALWEDCTAEMKSDLADLTQRDLRTTEVPEQRLIRLERRGFVRKEGKKLRSSCRLMHRFASGEAGEVGSLQRLFGEHARFDHNVRGLLEMRLAQVPVVDEALRGYVEQAIRHVHPEPRHAIVWIRSIVDRALDLVWQKELKDGTIIPESWMEEWARAGVRNTPDDGAGRLPGERGKQLRVLRYASGTGIQGRTIRRVTGHVTRPTALLLEHLQSVGNFGQHQEDEVDRPFAVTVCMAAITLCHCLARDLLD